MRITFVGLGWEQLSICLMSALAKSEGHEVSLAFNPSLFNDRFQFAIPALASIFDNTADVLKIIEEQKPDCLVFSALSGTYQWMIDVAEKAKKMRPGIKVIFGGVHTTAVPERVLSKPFVDYVVVGEGDVAFPMILRAIEEGGATKPIPNTRFKLPNGDIVQGTQTGFTQDLDALPIYEKTIYEEHMRFNETYITMASRGCPYRCTFCFNSFFARLPEGKSGKYVRMRSPEHMMYELRVARRRYGTKLFEFFDDVFTVDKTWLRKFLTMYKKEIDVPYQIFSHVNFIDEEIASLLSESGCRTAQIGMQSMNDDYKRVVCKRYETTATSAKALDLMKKYKIKVKLDHMLGLPGEPLEAQEVAHQFYLEHTPYRINAYWTNFFPGTDMLKEAIADGTISQDEAEAINEGKPFDCAMFANKYINSSKMRTYKIYETIYKLIPGFPPFLRKKLDVRFLEKLPVTILSLATFFGHVTIGIARLDPDTFYYITYYFYHIKRFISAKIGFKSSSATRVLDGSPFALKPEIKKVEELSKAVV